MAPTDSSIWSNLCAPLLGPCDSEIAVEIDPALDAADDSALAKCGVNRASFGVQSFDLVVQRAINRVQSFEETARRRLNCGGPAWKA